MSQSSYRKILKTTSLFGGVQVFQILITIIKSKFVAIFLGSVGMGISGLFLSTITMIVSIAGLGLNYSGVREISKVSKANKIKPLSRLIKVFRSWVVLSGLLGAIGTIALASYLSKTAFGNYNYSTAFIVLSIVVFMTIVLNGNNAILQGMRHHRSMVKSSMIGATSGLLISVPLYYFYGVKGIVPAIIIASVTALSVSFYYTRKIDFVAVDLSFKERYNEGKGMAKLGMVMMVSVFIGALAIFVVNAFISNTGGVGDVGLYQAGMKLSNEYIGLVFTAMAVDYLPRLSAICDDNNKVREMVNQQAEIVILIIAPLLLFLIITVPILVRILLTEEFMKIIPFVRWVALGTIFKAAVYSVGYISFAKGDKWFFLFVDAISGNITLVILNTIFYKYWNLNGLGISLLLVFIIGFIKITIFTRYRYKFRFTAIFYKLFAKSVLFCLAGFMIVNLVNGASAYALSILVLIGLTLFSYKELNTRIDLKSAIARYMKR